MCIRDRALDAMRFEECTPVQEHTIPVILEGKDLIGVAQTGTGDVDKRQIGWCA